MWDDSDIPRSSTGHARAGRPPPAPSTAAETAGLCLHALVEGWARRAPESVAVSFGEEEVGYGELDRRAESVARRLRRLGVGPECLVGLCAERSVEMVVGLLGVLKAGGAYLPLDPDYPEDRLRFMWKDSRRISLPGSPSVVLSQGRLAERLQGWLGGAGVHLELLDGGDREGHEPLGSRAETAPSLRSSPRNLAYVIYTSGSTGRPKGVMVEHRGVVNVVRHAARELAVEPGSRVLQLASLSFDASVLEIFTALGCGARLVLTPRETLLSGEALGVELRRREIHTMAIPPSLLDKVPEGVELPSLRSIVVGGEACSAATARRWAPERIFVNAYAPTEATIYTTAGRCESPFDRPPAMGTPIPETGVRVLDPWGREVADGEVGELCLGGLGLARGYGGRPGLTAERFVPDPLGDESEEPGARLYRSGDLGRRLPDASLEFAGRTDHQVKVRGLRIELGEIEATLGEHPAVRQAVVMRREDLPGDAKLVGYVVLERHQKVSPSELRAFLAERLPEPMVPSAFVTLESFPQTATGKIDRRALPAPGPERPDLSTEYLAPGGLMETALAGIWGDLLGLERVGIDDDLFELGGHSLVVAQMVNRVRQELGLELPLQAPFEHPTVRALSTFLEDQVASGVGEVREGPSSTDRLPPIERTARQEGSDEPIPLSFPQERIWFVQQLAPSAIAYNFQFSLRMRGTLSIPALERTLAELVRRHEVLRTTFPAVDGRPVQEIHAPFPIEMPVVDLSRVPAQVREETLRRRVLAEVRRGFRVTELPLLRWTLFRLAPDDHLWLQVEHHFLHDGWSLGVYLRELEAIYGAFRAGEPSPLPEPEIQYADFARWQRRFMEGDVFEEQLAFWRAKLSGSPPVLELPTDRPRGRAHGFRGGCLRVDLDPELYRKVRAFGRRQGVTLFMTMLAAFDALMYRYTGREDFLLGSGLANRRLKETEDLVGMVVNTLVIRSRLDGRTTVRELLDQVRATTLELHLYQDMPFEKLVEKLQPDRDLSRNPLFQVLFSFHDAPVPDVDLPGLSTHLFEWHNGSAKADLNVVVKPVAEQRVGRQASAADDVLTMVWEYSADLLERPTVERMWGHYQRLLAALVEAPETSIERLPMLTTAEERQLAAWGRGPSPSPSTGAEPIHLAVLRRARELPAAPAVVTAGVSLSYGELVARASELAGRLREPIREGGAGPESVVALLTGRSPETAVAALAVLSSGASYLPLDPDYPVERLAFMLDDAGAACLVVRPDLADLLPETAVPVLEISTDQPAPDPALDPMPERVQVTADHRAYVVYTSGSTGRPKGVEVTHGGLANLVAWHLGEYSLGADDRAALVAGPAFDAAVWELWSALAAGISLHVPEDAVRSDPRRLLAWLTGEGITVTFLPTPLAEAVLEEIRLGGSPEDLRLRVLLTGGDRLHRPPPAGLPFRLINHYGPTESTVVSTAGPVTPDARTPPPIGVPITGLAVEVVDGGLATVPVGVPGELRVGGAGLARGYLGRPGLTAERFVPAPSPRSSPAVPRSETGTPSPEPSSAGWGGRLYRTGDLVRWLPTAELEFLGRIDRQVKIRGFRVELGEIESLLAAQEGVRAAAVVLRDGALTGYVAAPPEVRTEELRGTLSRRLPEYMVPGQLVRLDSLPLTPNGKIDRRALPPPDRIGEPGAAPPAPPRTPTEELVASLWCHLLDVERVGVHDDFFHLGGHSLLATRLLARLRDATGAEVLLTDLFEAPTVAGLARRVEARLRQRDPHEETTAVIPRRGEDGPAPLSFAQERLWFLDRLAPGSAAYNVARTLRLEGGLDRPALAGALVDVAHRHRILRTRLAVRDGRAVQVMDLPPPRLPVVDLGALRRERRESSAVALARAEAGRPFDLERGPLVRTSLLDLGSPAGGSDRVHFLLLTFHHAVFDGWSMEIFTGEVGAAYHRRTGKKADAPPVPPELPIQYADFAVWQRRHLSGERLERLLGYWRSVLAGAPPVLELPVDRPRPRTLSGRGARVVRPLPPVLPPAVRKLAGRRRVTPFMVLLAGFAALLHRYTGRADPVVGTPMAHRDRSEVQGLIGFFANSLVLRLDAGGDPTFGELVDRSRDAVLGAYAHQEVPFEKLVQELDPERDLSRSSLFQVLFAIEEGTPDALDLPGVTARRVDLPRTETKFDLSLTLASPGGFDAERAAGLAAVAQYSTDLFDATRIARLLDHLGRLLEAGVASPNLPLSHLPLLAPAERQQVVAEWNDTADPSSLADDGAGTLAELVARRAETAPDAVAVVFEGSCLSFRELSERARRWAIRLRSLGVGPDVLVGLCVERSPEMMVGLLAVVESGGAYVPLDPDYPAERLGFMLDDSGVHVVLTLERLRHLLPEPAVGAPTVLCLDVAEAGGEAMDVPATDAAAAVAGPDHAAYTIYTSGSTGRPKGALNTHRAVVNRLLWMRDEYGIGQDDTLLQKTPTSFDVSVWELFLPPVTGARLVVARPEEHRNPAYLAETVQRERVTTLHFVPSMLEAFVGQPGVEVCRSLRRVVASGEALVPSLVGAFRRRLDCPLYNLYGPTEAAVDVTAWAGPTDPDGREPSVVPIGRPIANARVQVVDGSLRPAPLGVPGELVLGGVPPCRGYLRRPALTAERFVPDPQAGESAASGGRIYRTGDLCRTSATGEVEYLGRLDFQVKIRGHRIETGEVESALRSHPTVREAVVVARPGAGRQLSLAAFVTAAHGTEPSPDDLLEHLRRTLPEPMVPAAVAVLDELPLSPSGKADRRALTRRPLAAPGAAGEGGADAPVPPRTALERDLARLWSEVLEVDSVGVNEDFFALGGNSIVGAIAINRLQEILGEIVHVVVLFEAPTVAAMAGYLAESHAEAVARIWPGEVAPAARTEREPPVTEADVELLRRSVPALAPAVRSADAPKNRPAVFVLAPYRSGSTLLRVMLGGHPELFAPPELELLGFDTLAERERVFSGRHRFYREGAVRAAMELRGWSPGEAAAALERYAAEGLTTRELYRRFQEWLGDRTLVDKTPSYVLDLALLRRAEEWFDDARYVHLVRHPGAVVASFEEARLDEVVPPWEHPFSRRRLAESIWLLSHRNVVRFLEEIPSERRCTVIFEELVREPERVLRELSRFLGIDYHPAMADPYSGASGRMTDGLHASSRMLGDVKFHRHARVDPAAADRWRERAPEIGLGEPTRRLAAELGYDLAPRAAATGAPPLVPLPRPQGPAAADFAPSFAQERLWFLDRLEPDGAFYNLPVVARFTGALRRPLLSRALDEVTRRHEALRTKLPEVGGAPVQRIAPAAPVPLPVIDLQALPGALRSREARRLAAAESARPFDLARGPLVRSTLLDLGSTAGRHEHRLLVTFHHAVSDGWSLGVLLSELSELYTTFATGRPPALPELPVQYADFAVWQRRFLADERLEREIAYWRRRLAGAPSLLELPTDRPRPAVQSFRGGRLPFRLAPRLRDALGEVARDSGTTLFMVLLAAFAAFLSRHSGQRDVVVGSPIAGRNRREVEGLIGLFVNTLALRLELDGVGEDPLFGEILGAARNAALGAYGHQELPFERLVQELAPERSLAHAPVFQAMLVLQNAPRRPFRLPEVEVEAMEPDSRTTKFDLVLSLAETPEGLRGSWQFDTDLFDTTTCDRFARRFRSLLEAVAGDRKGRQLPLSTLPLVMPAERHQMLREWNDTGIEEEAVSRSVDAGATLAGRFAARAQATPDAIALVWKDQRSSFRELARRAAELAAELRRRGAGPEVRVAIRRARTPDLVISILAVLEAGAAYVPLDPAHPEERLAFMLRDGDAALVLTDDGVKDGAAASAARARNASAGTARPGNLAYVLYTSGSTGKPKAVAVEHRSAVALLDWARELFGAADLGGVLAATSVCFDLSVFELFLPLTEGGTVVLADDALELPRLAAAGAVSLVNTVPSALGELLHQAGVPPSVRTVNLAGEPLRRHLAQEVSATGADRLFNLYGPSEDTTYSTVARVVPEASGEPTIGRPVRGTRAHVLDPGLRAVPSGVVGELALAGAGLARGYLERPRETAERFVPDPFGAGPGERLYRTGDLVRFRADGELLFLGRTDHQVKLRGFRIELEEIEVALLDRPEVAEAVVLARRDGPGGPDEARLVAYAVLREPEGIEAGALRDALAARLPEYMVPQAIVLLPTFPRLPTGKVDRTALPAPGAGVETADEDPPATPVEELLADIWCGVLGVESVGRGNDFFALGGHSLLATRVISRLRSEIGLEVPVRLLFRYPRLRDLGGAVEELLLAEEE